jgi:hypothetical protein
MNGLPPISVHHRPQRHINTQENPMASILFTIVPVVLTFAVAAWSPNSKQDSSTLQRCPNC